MLCPNCNNENLSGSCFCARCGAKLMDYNPNMNYNPQMNNSPQMNYNSQLNNNPQMVYNPQRNNQMYQNSSRNVYNQPLVNGTQKTSANKSGLSVVTKVALSLLAVFLVLCGIIVLIQKQKGNQDSNTEVSKSTTEAVSRETEDQEAETEITEQSATENYENSAEEFEIVEEYEFDDSLGMHNWVKFVIPNVSKAITCKVTVKDENGNIIDIMEDTVNISKGDIGAIHIQETFFEEKYEDVDRTKLNYEWEWETYLPLIQGNTDYYEVDSYNVSGTSLYAKVKKVTDEEETVGSGIGACFFKNGELIDVDLFGYLDDFDESGEQVVEFMMIPDDFDEVKWVKR